MSNSTRKPSTRKPANVSAPVASVPVIDAHAPFAFYVLSSVERLSIENEFSRSIQYGVIVYDKTGKPGLSHKAKIEISKTARLGKKVLICRELSGAGKIDQLLASPDGVTLEEMRKYRGAVESHLNSLKKRGFHIVRRGNKYFCLNPDHAVNA